MDRKTKSIEIGGETLTFETGEIARQANAAVLLKQGDTTVFSTVCTKHVPDADLDFFPLRVDYTEKFSSAGKTLGGFIKREGRPTERETLVCRLIDRPIRPMFPDGYFDEVQILNSVWSYDNSHMPDVMAICASSAALVLSDAPMLKPIGAVRVGRIEGEFIINPSHEQMGQSELDLVLAGTEDGIMMIEGFCDFLTEEEVIQAIETGHKSIKVICAALKEWGAEVGKQKRLDTIKAIPEELLNELNSTFGDQINESIRIVNKHERDEALSAIHSKITEKYFPENEEPVYTSTMIKRAYSKIKSKRMRDMVLNEGRRCDERALDEIRQITVRPAVLPRPHGNCLFTRGETQTMAVCTLGGSNMGQRYEDLNTDAVRNFYLQYFFPPYSVGEVGRVGPPARREVGHGKLAERALQAAIPSVEDFPYAIRVESNITESNGSSSMASVCGGCLAMMEAGVPIKRPISGIAMGLILEGEKFSILSDILGVEDALGDMDFKITGDDQGITAFQMDIKVDGITLEIMRSALAQAKSGRVHILEKMLEVCPEHKGSLSPYAPRILTIQVKPSQIGTIIGPGGKQIRAIIEDSGPNVEVDINDDGIVTICGTNAKGVEKAEEIVRGLIAEVEVGKIYQGKVTSVVPFGLFVEILPGKEGLCHVSEIDFKRIENTADFAKQGDEITVKVLDVSDQGKVKLSRKATLKKEKQPEKEKVQQ